MGTMNTQHIRIMDLDHAELESVSGGRGTLVRSAWRLANRIWVAVEAAEIIGPVDVSQVGDPMDTKLGIN